MTAVAFKEWQVVCEALASGRQKLILRKGGIHEGRAGFSFAHDSFFLFPTRFHAQASQVREGSFEPAPEWSEGDTIRITHHAEAVTAVTLADWEMVRRLAPHHIYSEQTVRERFEWQGGGAVAGSIHVALVRIRELARPWHLPYRRAFGGCRSWVELPGDAAAYLDGARPVPAESFDTLRSLLQEQP
jgi:hypothetical protein